MAMAEGSFGIVTPGSDDVWGFDFSAALAVGDAVATIDSVSFTLASGTDLTPASHISGPAQVQGSEGLQRLNAFTLGNQVYLFAMNARTLNNKIIPAWAYFAVGMIGGCEPPGGCNGG